MSSSESDDTGTSEYSSDSSEEDGMEPAYFCGTKLQLPQGLCEKKEIFEEFFTVDLWNSFSDEHKEHLQSFLPNFPENDDLEKTKTLQRLFDFDNFHFSNPLMKFFDNLKAGHYRPDIAQMRQLIRKNEEKEARYRYKICRKQMKTDLIESQKKLVMQMRSLPPGYEPKNLHKSPDSEDQQIYFRTKKRYFQTLSNIRSKMDEGDFSPDENYPEGPCPRLPKKFKRHLNAIKNSLGKEVIFNSTMDTKYFKGVDVEKIITGHYNPFLFSDENYKNMLARHRKRKMESCSDPELATDDITITDVVQRTQLPYIKNLQMKPPPEPKKKRIKKEEVRKLETPPPPAPPPKPPSDTESESDIDFNLPLPEPEPALLATIKEEIKAEPEEEIVTVADPSPLPIINYEIAPIKMEDLETIDIMNTPIELDNSEIDIMELNIKPELMQETHSNFFSLIRDVICSTIEHRMNMYTLQERLKAWQENPISPLNDWYNFVDNWINILPSAITFLCGNASEQPDDFVPYMEYKLSLDVYQWIGAGRDSDMHLFNLCAFWLQHRTESKSIKPEEIELDIADRDSTPPPPRCRTTWTVRKAAPDEIRDYREQERRRYDNPHKAFTFRCNGYESVVGPLKGMYYPAPQNSKARGHTMLNADRPNFVTILSLVRDATARLPNGEGTRSDICELLKSSQYISSSAPDNILQSVVSGALDRMHTQWDPCVKYDQKRKIWIYLHRHRSEDDFERIHQHYQGVQKAKKNPRKTPVKPKTPKKTPKKAPSTPVEVDEVKIEEVVEPEVVVEEPKVKRRQSLLKEEKVVVVTSTPSLVPTQKSLLLTNQPKQERVEEELVQIPLEMLKGQKVKIMAPNQKVMMGQQVLKQIPSKTPFLQSITKPKPKLEETKLQDKVPKQMVQLQNVKLLRAPSTNLDSESDRKTQTQQVLQALKQQKFLPNANVLTPQQQVLLKQKGCVVQIPKTVSGAKTQEGVKVTNQVPLVKVTTNAAGQVISVDLAHHQKGTSLRVQGSKPVQQNLIHLTSTTKPSAIAHFAVGTQNNLVALTTQPKLVMTQASAVTTTTTQAKPRNVGVARAPPKTQHLKIITTDGAQKVVQMGQGVKMPAKRGTFSTSLRMLNTANLNLTTLDGKPVLLASKSGIQSLHGQNVIVQAHATTPTSSSLVIQGAVKKPTTQTQAVLNQPGNIVFSTVKNQLQQQVLFSSQGKTTPTTQASHIVLGNQQIRLQGAAGGSQRVALVGQGGQIVAQHVLLPAGLAGIQGINIKSLQGVKVIPIAQNQKGQSRQIVAKVMGPTTVVKQGQTVQLGQQPDSVTIHSSESE